jgi:hypothetical protein
VKQTDADRVDDPPVIGDTELRDLTIASLTATGHDDDFPYAIATIEDVDAFHEIVCNAIPPGSSHPVTHLSVWPAVDEPDALITLDLPNGLRVATLCVTVSQFQPAPAQTGTAAAVEAALGELLYQGQMLADQFESAVQAALEQRRATLTRRLLAGLTRRNAE